MISLPTQRLTAVEDEISFFATATAKAAWGSRGHKMPFETLSEDARQLLEECVRRGIQLGMAWGPS